MKNRNIDSIDWYLHLKYVPTMGKTKIDVRIQNHTTNNKILNMFTTTAAIELQFWSIKIIFSRSRVTADAFRVVNY